jgi:hypothetical protein
MTGRQYAAAWAKNKSYRGYLGSSKTVELLTQKHMASYAMATQIRTAKFVGADSQNYQHKLARSRSN